MIRKANLDMSNQSIKRPSMFTLHFDNRKKRGWGGLKKFQVEGTLYSSGHVHLDTEDIPITGFESLGQMLSCLGEFGDCTVVWPEEQTA